eukprot:4741420-Prymnesium_polylepis.1
MRGGCSCGASAPQLTLANITRIAASTDAPGPQALSVPRSQVAGSRLHAPIPHPLAIESPHR